MTQAAKMASWAFFISGLILAVSLPAPTKRNVPASKKIPFHSPVKREVSQTREAITQNIHHPSTEPTGFTTTPKPNYTGINLEDISAPDIIWMYVRRKLSEIALQSKIREVIHGSSPRFFSSQSSLATQRFLHKMEKFLTTFRGNLRLAEDDGSGIPGSVKTGPIVDDLDMGTATSCTHIYGYTNHPFVSVVNRCPVDFTNATIRWQCSQSGHSEGIYMHLPVQDRRGVVYANQFCAACNGVDRYLKWHASYACDHAQPSGTALVNALSTSALDLITLISESCTMTVVPSLPKLVQNCTFLFRQTFDHQPVITQGQHVPSSNYPVSFNIIFNFDLAGKSHILYADGYQEEMGVEKRACPDGEIYDTNNNVCRSIFCSDGLHLEGSDCVPDAGSSEDAASTKEPDLLELTNSRDIERVDLSFEIPLVSLMLLTMAELKEFCREELADKLNISLSRLPEKYFNIDVMENTGNYSINVHKISEEEYAQMRSRAAVRKLPEHLAVTEAVTDDGDIVSEVSAGEGEEGVGTMQPSPAATGQGGVGTFNTVSPESRDSSSISPNRQGPDLGPQEPTQGITERPGQPTPQEPTQDIKKRVGQKYTRDPGPQNSETADSRTKDTTTSSPRTTLTPGVQPPIDFDYPVGVKVSFVLLPPPQTADEQTSATVVQVLKSMIQTGSFSFEVNGTSYPVGELSESAPDIDYEYFCPYGKSSTIVGPMSLVLRTHPVTGEQSEMLLIESTGQLYPVGRFELTATIEGDFENNEIYDQLTYAFVCDMPHIARTDCARILISRDEYEIVNATDKLVSFQNHIYNITMYEVMNETTGDIEICVPESYTENLVVSPPRRVPLKNCLTGYEKVLKAEGYLTAVLGRVSIVALASVLLTYTIFPSLRNLPGVNTMNLTFALFLAEVIFITGEDEQIPWLCSAVAASLHYCFLASHCWMNVMTFDVYRTFAASSCILTRIGDKRKFLPRYAIYAWGAPVLIVGLCLLIDFGDVFPGIDVKYGGTWSSEYLVNQGGNLTQASDWGRRSSDHDNNYVVIGNATDYSDGGGAGGDGGVTNTTLDSTPRTMVVDHSFSCWIQNPLAALFAFGAPILLIFLVNCFLFGRTIMTIRRTSSFRKRTGSDSSVRHLSGRSDVILYIKMSSVMGFTWVFGLASSAISAIATEPTEAICAILHTLGILFPILNCSQGLFIFFAFVCNRRVFGYYKAVARKLKRILLRRKAKLVIGHLGRPKKSIATIYRA